MFSFVRQRALLMIVALVVLSACSVVTYYTLDERYGKSDDTRYDQPKAVTNNTLSYHQDVKPVLENRCVVCHGCYDAPCQLKMSAWEGLARGANKTPVYDSVRLLEAETTRLFEDASKTSQWRQKKFYPVLNERADTPEANINGSVLAQMLLLKQEHPLPDSDILPATFDFSLSRKQQCPRIEEFNQFAKDQPLWGMPFGLPQLNDDEHDTLIEWLEQGAPREPAAPLRSELQNEIRRWENFLNGDSFKRQLMARYIYEHLFLAHIYFSEETVAAAHSKTFFKLVRSSTPPGETVKRIASRRPYDDPGVARVYYRLIPEQESIINKTHMPYRLDRQRYQLWKSLFIDEPYTVTSLPGYAPEIATNPFVSFSQIPAKSRYRFMLEEAQFTVMGFIKGPVCRGDVALNVINDHFWVYFIDPDMMAAENSVEFLSQQSHNLSMPAKDGSNASLLDFWLHYSKQQKQYLIAKSDYLSKTMSQINKPGLDLLWDGDGTNSNAALTVFRHYDSATVLKGTVGDEPQTVWVLSYALLERIHYLLVSGFDVYGNSAHQLNTRLYMDFLRMEGEFNFLAFIPEDKRIALRDHWYRNANPKTKEYVYGSYAHFNYTLSIPLKTDNPKQELLGLISQKLSPVLDRHHSLIHVDDLLLRKQLIDLNDVKGGSLKFLPETVMLKINRDNNPPLWMTLIRNTAFTNVSQLLNEDDRRRPAEDTLTLAYGFVGSYPNAFWEIDEEELPALTTMIGALTSNADYGKLMSQFGIRRSNEDFWEFSDEAHQAMRAYEGIDYGLLDYNRLENR
jgi:hypothetical protein